MKLAFLPRRYALSAVLLTLTVPATACRDRPSDGDLQMVHTSASAMAPVAQDEAAAKGKSVSLMERGPSAEEPQVRASRPPGTRPQAVVPNMIIRHGEASVQVDSLEEAMAAVRRLAASLGGYIGNVSISTGQHQLRSASLEMKIPASRFDDAMAGMKPLGRVQHSTATAQDVGEEFVDVTARIANAKRLETRLVSLLASRTGKLEDVLAVERELARVREEIERYEGRIRYLSAHIATSTIVATVHEKAPLVAGQPGRNPIRQAFLNMWRNFVLFVAWGIEALGVVIPVAVVALVVARAWRRWRRARVGAAEVLSS